MSNTYLTRVAQLNSAKAMARRHPGMSKAIKEYVDAEAADLDLTGLDLEALVRLGVGNSRVLWGPEANWGIDTADAEIWLWGAGDGGYRLGICTDGRDGYWLSYFYIDRSYGNSKHLKTAKALIAAVDRWASR